MSAFFFFFSLEQINPLTWCRWERCLLGSRTGAVSWTRDPRGCREESPGFLRTSTPWRRALQEDRETQRRRSRRVRLRVCLPMTRPDLHHLNTSLIVHLLHLSCSRWPQAVNQQYEAVVADNLMLCCLADSKDTFGTTDGWASAASRSICRYPVPGRSQQDWIHEIQPSKCPVSYDLFIVIHAFRFRTMTSLTTTVIFQQNRAVRLIPISLRVADGSMGLQLIDQMVWKVSREDREGVNPVCLTDFPSLNLEKAACSDLVQYSV